MGKDRSINQIRKDREIPLEKRFNIGREDLHKFLLVYFAYKNKFKKDLNDNRLIDLMIDKDIVKGRQCIKYFASVGINDFCRRIGIGKEKDE